MGQRRPRLAKPTLDKDLEKFSSVEEAARQMSRGLAAPGTALLFIILVAIFAASYVTGKPGAVVVIAASGLAAYMAMNIGANDVTNNIGAAVGARAMTMTFGLGLAAVFEVAGAVLAGRGVANTIANGIMQGGMISSPDVLIWAMMAALLSAAVLINVATWLGAPISTTHSIVGGVMGAGIAAAGLSAVNWGTIAGITASWVFSPILGAVIAAAFLFFVKETIIYREDKVAAAKKWVPVLIGVMTGAFAGYLALLGLGELVDVSAPVATLIALLTGLAAWRLLIPVIARQAEGLENRNQSLRTLFRIPLILSAALLSFAHGANDVSNAIGPLAAIVSAAQRGISTGVRIPLWELIIGGLGISLGLLLYGPKLVRLVGAEITKLNPMRAYCVSLSTALTVIVASWIGLPVSSTHIAVGAVFGVGFFREWYTRHSRRRFEYMRVRAGKDLDTTEPFERNDDELKRRYLVRRSHFLSIIAAWMITLPAAATLAALIATAMFALFV
ncbi:inorganic phosphate transporter [Neorhizobium galegae]|uniref:inorganic phosphate transporter n=1 Tax=Neorhizobium galegae TaxID=399 RepID=UPI0006228359|nr:inorganic phosphate transporter [Neorhizobium galegae]MCQ1764234.1 inorganic phosphate transporter [Neorhizobium galegae]MCQ1846061.1 inorganic phosphate transporter [Neorhizobium galegae]CDZ35863.1 Phosphate permease [Neorhizobium galegae bv. officinalis]